MSAGARQASEECFARARDACNVIKPLSVDNVWRDMEFGDNRFNVKRGRGETSRWVNEKDGDPSCVHLVEHGGIQSEAS